MNISTILARGFGILFLIGVALSLWSCSSGFSEADIVAMKKSIREEFENKSEFAVTDVVMMKESSTKATGFVKLRSPRFGDITKSCSATMAESGKDYMWQCN